MDTATIALVKTLVHASNQKRTYTVWEIQNILGISRPTAYTLVKKNLFRSIRVGGQIRISKKSFDEWLDQGVGGAVNE